MCAQWSAFCGQVTKTMTQWLRFVNQPLEVTSVKEFFPLSSSSVYSQTLTSLFGDASAPWGHFTSGQFQKPRCHQVLYVQRHWVGKVFTSLQSLKDENKSGESADHLLGVIDSLFLVFSAEIICWLAIIERSFTGFYVLLKGRKWLYFNIWMLLCGWAVVAVVCRSEWVCGQ